MGRKRKHEERESKRERKPLGAGTEKEKKKACRLRDLWKRFTIMCDCIHENKFLLVFKCNKTLLIMHCTFGYSVDLKIKKSTEEEAPIESERILLFC